MPRPITATIITLNEERNIEEVIASAKRVCDEVIVVDSCSTDRTVELAEKAGAKVIIQPYLGDGPQKNFGVPFAKNDWIFSIDADERFEDEAVEVILKLDLEKSPYDSYDVRRKTYIGEKWIRTWYPDYVTRLYDRRKAAYTNVIGHASVVGGRNKKLKCDLAHYSYKDLSDLIKRIDKFAARGARQLLEKGERVSVVSPVTHGIGRFFKQLVLRRGFVDGFYGLTVAAVSGFGAYMKYAIALEKQRNSEEKQG